MDVSSTIPRAPGVFALLHAKTATAYVNETRDLRQRALLWQQRLNGNGGDIVPAKDFPKHPAEEWTFWVSDQGDLASTRAALTAKNWKLINDYRPRKTYTIVHKHGQTVIGSLAVHCKQAGVKLHTVYKRLNKGMSVEQALGLTASPPPDKREIAISQMRIQIETDTGGLLTYDEALFLRPEIGDIREKLRRLRKREPERTKVKLAEI